MREARIILVLLFLLRGVEATAQQVTAISPTTGQPIANSEIHSNSYANGNITVPRFRLFVNANRQGQQSPSRLLK